MKVADLFCGAGGFSEGAEMADCAVVWCANHSREAVDTHARNHPDAIHVVQDLHLANWELMPSFDGLLASPCCQGHTPARGKAHNNPRHDASRSTAWCVVAAAEFHRPAFFLVENVPEFLDWTLYPAWKGAMEALGYSLAPHIVDAADHGVPQNRQRLFILGTRSRVPLFLDLPKLDHVPAASFIDFAAGRWSNVEKPGRAAATLRRVAAGRRAHGDHFLMPYYGNGSGLTGRSLARPIGTLTTCARWAVVRGDDMRMLSIPEALAAMSFRKNYLLPASVKAANHMLGNAVAPLVARDVLRALRAAI